MKLNYNVTGKERKRMVAVIGEVTEIKPIYTRMPECAYVIGDIKVSKIGELIAEDEELVTDRPKGCRESGRGLCSQDGDGGQNRRTGW